MNVKKLVDILIRDYGREYEVDIYWLISYVTGLSRTRLMLEKDRELSIEQIADFGEMFDRRLTGEPIQYILSSAEFMGLDFYVDKDVLIPRFDTEILVDYIVKNVCKADFEFIDMCCGSGCIGISILSLTGANKCTFVDISDKAINIATKNSKSNAVFDRSEFIVSNLFEEVSSNKVDFIVSNPPYIKTGEMDSLSKEVKNEPSLALDGGESGTLFYEKIVPQSINYLKNGGTLVFEIGFDEADDVRFLLEKNGFTGVEVIKDLAGLDRVVKGNYYV